MVYFNKGKWIKTISLAALALVIAGGAVVGGDYIVHRQMNKAFDNQKPTMASTEAVNWGLSFGEEGKPPVGNATAEYLKIFDAYYMGDEKTKNIYLTFDCGYENGNTAKILDTLKEKKVKATFFCTGNFVRDEKDLIKRMAREGHIVGNHTMTHPDMSAIASKEAFEKEIQGVEALYKAATGKEMPKYYRPPQGKFCESNLKMAKEMGYKTIFWSLAYVDWLDDKQPTREEAFAKLMPRTHGGAIILLHSTSKTNGQILGDLIDQWREDGYSIKALDGSKDFQ